MPTPTPPRKRHSARVGPSCATAHSTDVVTNRVPATIMRRRRPKRSAIVPAEKAPTAAPRSALATITPTSALPTPSSALRASTAPLTTAVSKPNMNPPSAAPTVDATTSGVRAPWPRRPVAAFTACPGGRSSGWRSASSEVLSEGVDGMGDRAEQGVGGLPRVEPRVLDDDGRRRDDDGRVVGAAGHGLGVVEVVERHVAHPLGGHHHDVGAGRRAVGEVEPDLDARVVGTGVEQAQALVTREGRVLARAVRRDPAVADRPARRPDLGATCRGARR